MSRARRMSGRERRVIAALDHILSAEHYPVPRSESVGISDFEHIAVAHTAPDMLHYLHDRDRYESEDYREYGKLEQPVHISAVYELTYPYPRRAQQNSEDHRKTGKIRYLGQLGALDPEKYPSADSQRRACQADPDTRASVRKKIVVVKYYHSAQRQYEICGEKHCETPVAVGQSFDYAQVVNGVDRHSGNKADERGEVYDQ